jgi:hypothetical protein
MISLAAFNPIISAAKAVDIGIVDDGGNVVAGVRRDRGWAPWLIGASFSTSAGTASQMTHPFKLTVSRCYGRADRLVLASMAGSSEMRRKKGKLQS